MVRRPQCPCCELLIRKANIDWQVQLHQSVVYDVVSTNWLEQSYYKYWLVAKEQQAHNEKIEKEALSLSREKSFAGYLIAMDECLRVERDSRAIMQYRFQGLEYKVQHMFGAHRHG